MSTTEVPIPRRGGRRRTLPGYKACRNCKYVVPEDTTTCPLCGGTDFTVEWRGLIIVLDVEKSCLAKKLGITKPGMYAIDVP